MAADFYGKMYSSKLRLGWNAAAVQPRSKIFGFRLGLSLRKAFLRLGQYNISLLAASLKVLAKSSLLCVLERGVGQEMIPRSITSLL
jgi:hypothetical protein